MEKGYEGYEGYEGKGTGWEIFANISGKTKSFDMWLNLSDIYTELIQMKSQCSTLFWLG